MVAENFLAQRLDLLTERYRETVRGDKYYYEVPFEEQTSATATIAGRRHVVLSSYSYLGLLHHPDVQAAAFEALRVYGTSTHGVRLLAGTLPLHHELEAALARFKSAEASIVFSSGYATNIAVVSALMTRNDVVICDKLDHASIVDGCALSQATFMPFRHNDMADLERCLQQSAERNQLVIVDGVYSMDGDVADLPEICRLCREYGAAVMVDEAHSIGVLGATGRGIEEHFGLPAEAVDIKMGTLSKAIPASGGYVAGSQQLIDALRHNARPYIFSGALAPPLAAGALAALEVIRREPQRIQRLHSLTRRVREALVAAGCNVLASTTPIIPLIGPSEDAVFEATGFCRERDVFVTPVVFPAVPKATPRLRLAVNAGFSDDEVEYALDVVRATALAGASKVRGEA